MAWWPFGKKKESATADGRSAATPSDYPKEGRTVAVPPPNVAEGAPAPTIFVPPEFAQGEVASSELPTIAPQPAAFDPFAPAAKDDFSKTLQDPDSPKLKKIPRADPFAAGADPFAEAPAPALDPFAAPASPNDFNQTMSDESELDDQRTIPPSHVMKGLAPRKGPGATPAAPTDGFGSDAPDHTLRMPGAPHPAPNEGSDGLTFTASPPPAAPPSPAAARPPAHEETPMLAKTSPLTPEKLRLGRALLAGGPITQEKLAVELEKSGKSQSVLGKALLKSNFPREEELLAALVAQIRIPKINVKNTKIPLETIKIVPAAVARQFQVLPIEKLGDILVVVSPGVGDEEALAAVRKATGCSVFPFQCDADGFIDVLEGYYDRLATSGIAPAISPQDAFSPPPPPPGPAARPAQSGGPVAALPASDGQDEWERIYAASGPVPAEEVLL